MIENDVEHLYTTKDVARVRDKLKQEQNNLDPITGLEIPDKQAVLTVYGVGYVLTEPTKVNYIQQKEYKLWTNMLGRCYDPIMLAKMPTYKGCTVSETFKCYDNFARWCRKQVGFGVEGFSLDKDLLSGSSKVYSEATCCFLPRAINSCLVANKRRRGNLPIGVTFHKQRKRFMASLRIPKEGSKHLGYFDTPEDAFKAYKLAKEVYVKFLAEKFKSEIDVKAYNALLEWEVHFDD